MIFFTITCRTTLWRSLFLQILQVGTKIEIYHRLFCGDNFTSKNFNKLFLVDSLLACTKLRIHQGILKQLGRNFCKIVRKTYVVEFPLGCANEVYSLLQIHSGSAQKGKDILKFQKFQKSLCGTIPFSPTLQSCSPEFLSSASTDSKKNVSFDCSEVIASLPEKGL